MPDTPFTQQRAVQFRGPSTSDDYNSRIAENYKDLVTLYNRMRIEEDVMIQGYGRFVKSGMTVVQTIQDLENRVAALELAQPISVTFSNAAKMDNSRFDSTSYAMAPVSQLTQDTLHGVLTLPQVSSSSVSKLAFVDPTTGYTTLPTTLGTTVVGDPTTLEATAFIDTSAPELSMARTAGQIWQRNVVSSTSSGNAALTLYVQAPTDLFTTADSNTIILHPYPALGTDIIEVAYTTNISPTMQDSDGYVTFPPMHVNDVNGIGVIPPGSWGNSGDIDINAGFRIYYFDPVPITGLRIKLRQRNYFTDNGNYVFSYGASQLDLRFTKFLNVGKAMVRIDAPIGQTISAVESVQPKMWNVLEAEMPDVFSWQAVWETALNSGIYTTTPVPFSSRVWIQVTLTQTSDGGSPALSGLFVDCL